MPGLSHSSAQSKAQQRLRAPVPSAALRHCYFGYPSLPEGANRVSAKIAMLNGKLSNRGAGSVKGQRKVKRAGFVSRLPLYKLIVTKMRTCSYDRAHRAPPQPSRPSPCKRVQPLHPVPFPGACQARQGLACHRHGFAVLLRSTAF